MPEATDPGTAYEQRRNLVTAIRCRLETVLVSRSQGYDALGRPVTRTQQRGTEPARSDSFSYNGETNSPPLPWAAPPTAAATTTSATARRHGNRPRTSPTRPTSSTNTPALKKAETPFVPTYDASSNRTLIKTSTGVWTVVYNAANRAVSFTSRNRNDYWVATTTEPAAT